MWPAGRESGTRASEAPGAEPETTASETETPVEVAADREPDARAVRGTRRCARDNCVRNRDAVEMTADREPGVRSSEVSAAEPETTASETETPVEMTADREPDARASEAHPALSRRQLRPKPRRRRGGRRSRA